MCGCAAGGALEPERGASGPARQRWRRNWPCSGCRVGLHFRDLHNRPQALLSLHGPSPQHARLACDASSRVGDSTSTEMPLPGLGGALQGRVLKGWGGHGVPARRGLQQVHRHSMPWLLQPPAPLPLASALPPPPRHAVARSALPALPLLCPPQVLPLPVPEACLVRASTEGMRKPMVLPVPVLARAMTSPPARIWGREEREAQLLTACSFRSIVLITCFKTCKQHQAGKGCNARGESRHSRQQCAEQAPARQQQAAPPHRGQRGILHLCQVREAQHLCQGALRGRAQRQAGKGGGGQVRGGAARRRLGKRRGRALLLRVLRLGVMVMWGLPVVVRWAHAVPRQLAGREVVAVAVPHLLRVPAHLQGGAGRAAASASTAPPQRSRAHRRRSGKPEAIRTLVCSSRREQMTSAACGGRLAAAGGWARQHPVPAREHRAMVPAYMHRL